MEDAISVQELFNRICQNSRFLGVKSALVVDADNAEILRAGKFEDEGAASFDLKALPIAFRAITDRISKISGLGKLCIVTGKLSTNSFLQIPSSGEVAIATFVSVCDQPGLALLASPSCSQALSSTMDAMVDQIAVAKQAASASSLHRRGHTLRRSGARKGTTDAVPMSLPSVDADSLADRSVLAQTNSGPVSMGHVRRADAPFPAPPGGYEDRVTAPKRRSGTTEMAAPPPRLTRLIARRNPRAATNPAAATATTPPTTSPAVAVVITPPITPSPLVNTPPSGSTTPAQQLDPPRESMELTSAVGATSVEAVQTPGSTALPAPALRTVPGPLPALPLPVSFRVARTTTQASDQMYSQSVV